MNERRRDGLLALVLAQLTLLTYVTAASADVQGLPFGAALVAVLLVGVPAFVGGLVLLGPNVE